MCRYCKNAPVCWWWLWRLFRGTQSLCGFFRPRFYKSTWFHIFLSFCEYIYLLKIFGLELTFNLYKPSEYSDSVKQPLLILSILSTHEKTIALVIRYGFHEDSLSKRPPWTEIPDMNAASSRRYLILCNKFLNFYKTRPLIFVGPYISEIDISEARKTRLLRVRKWDRSFSIPHT